MELMKSYGIEFWQKIPNFSYRAMCYTILHEQPAFAGVWRAKPEWKNCKDIHQLELLLWSFEWPAIDNLVK